MKTDRDVLLNASHRRDHFEKIIEERISEQADEDILIANCQMLEL